MASLFWFLIGYTVLATILNLLVFSIQSEKIVDEVYHVPQVQKYCAGNFTQWDSKITTLPGLYLISVGLLYPVASLVRTEMSNLCSTSILRLTNVVLSIGNLYLFYSIFSKIDFQNKAASKQKHLLGALNLALVPPLFFFSSFYYTDVASVFMVLLMFSLHLNKSNGMAACAGALSILVRQTNAIWVLWVAVRSFDLALRDVLLLTRVERSYENIHTWREVECFFKGAMRLSRQPGNRITQLRPLLSSVLPYVVTLAFFALFVILNNGIVVGDRSAHEATMNFPQMFYFAAFSACFLGPYFLSNWQFVVRSYRRRLSVILLAAVICALVIRFNTLVHPYLLSDNRHYVFYVWKLVFEQVWLGRYYVIPVYIFSWICIWRYVSRVEPFLVTLAYIVCAILCIVPQRLLEVRYFFTLFVLLRLYIPNTSRTLLTVELVQNVFVNIVTLTIFVAKTFKWDDLEGWQRIIW